MSDLPPVSRARRIAAVLASVSTPGAGLLVLGRWRRGLVWAALSVGCVALAYAGFRIHPPLLVVGFLPGPILWIACLVDTARAKPGAALPHVVIAVLAWIGLMVTTRIPTELFRAFVAEAFKIPSGSMQPTLEVGDHLFIEKSVYSGMVPKRGDLVVYRHPEHPRQSYAKRIAGLPGDTIEIRENALFVNGEAQPHVLGASVTVGDAKCEAQDLVRFEETLGGVEHSLFHMRGLFSGGPWAVPEGRYFVLGDNRDNSNDSSRSPNYTIPLDHITGRVSFVWLSWDPCNKRIRTERTGLVPR